MASTEVINQILTGVTADIAYLLPVIAVCAGIKLVLDLLFDNAVMRKIRYELLSLGSW